MSEETKTIARLTLLTLLAFVGAYLTMLGARYAPAAAKPGAERRGAGVARLERSVATDPDLTAEAALGARLATGEVLYAKNADAELPIASLTKLMTALVVADSVSPLERIAMTEFAKADGQPDAKRSAIEVGDRIRAEDLLKFILISSDNDAATVAAEALGRGARGEATSGRAAVRRFVAGMNEAARMLGLRHTHFANPTGADDSQNYSTARDLGVLAAVISRSHPELWAISRMSEALVIGERGRRYGLTNTNPLLAEFPAIYGSKTGLETLAGGALVVVYELAPGDDVVLVLLKSRDRFADGRSFIRWFESGFVLHSE